MKRKPGHIGLMLALLASASAWGGGEYSNLAVEKTVDRHRPGPGEPVEFTIEVVNHGDYAAPDLHVQDKLQPPLFIPEGRGAFTDKGYYDPATGDWQVGELRVGESAVLVLPAIVQGADLPECVVNTAEVDHVQDSTSYNNRSSTAVRGATGRNCADLDAGFSLTPGKSSNILDTGPECDSRRPYDGSVRLLNRGPEVARNVEVSLLQEPVIGPNLRFDDSDCTLPTARVCQLAEMAVGTELRLDFVSDPFLNKSTKSQRFSVSVVSGSNDYDLLNNNPALDITVSAFSRCDQGGGIPGVPDPTIPLGGEGGGSGCFIATAAYGSYLHPQVKILRDFRDQVLQPSSIGRHFISLYYQYSPAVADYIAARDWLRALVRAALVPVVVFAAYPVGVSAVILILCLWIILTVRGRAS